ncbi:MAG: hypothetical protein CYPHOPRED_003969 [Cyphobasidiales sp. Tagirdzhanova-0007]|nr:MAG: hypothetical protein CYPHOPRED_003969 [Cyphobasidiales sp. Tagirdzhanova-0007]
MKESIFLQETLGALQATISVLLVLAYGAILVKYLKIIDSETVNKMTKLGTNVLLPCLLFTEMGPESKPSQLREYWIFPVYTLSFTILSLLYALIGVKLLKMPKWLYPAAAFPNTLSLPLLMIESLARTGAVDNLLNGEGDTVAKALARGRLYILVNGLAGNIIRFAAGPYLLRAEDDSGPSQGNGHGNSSAERQPLLGGIQPGQAIPNLHPRYKEEEQRSSNKVMAWKLWAGVRGFFNPPLVAGLLAIFIGMIGPMRRFFFSEDGPLDASFTQSLKTIGKLYTAMQMLVLGGKLVSKKTSRARFLPLAYLFLWRFFIVPVISISVVYGLRSRWPHYIKSDPVIDFVLAISHVGPPAITLAAMADMSGLDQEEQGVIATVLLASYVVTPLISLSVSGIMTIVDKLY